ncbi:MAG: DUF1684 domain-containing protein [candidate division KSB1 bacterium]|nr:DUF1684 domain-containing protein [candidate division KSB1 bacterium]MDQ7062782.1 DUF1684 domain-containing protein [candidate division KSB1 bacterium]
MKYARPISWLLLAAAAFSCGKKSSDLPENYFESIEKWHNERMASLKSETGWLNLAGLYWLEPGENRFGSANDNNLSFPESAPKYMGKFIWQDTTVTVDIAPGVEVLHDGKPVTRMRMVADTDGEPTVLSYGSLRWFIIRRGQHNERFGVRLRDLEHPDAKYFTGVERYPVDPAWRVQARAVKVEPPETLKIPTVIGDVLEEPVSMALEFELQGQTYRLYPSGESGDELFIIFADPTNFDETYGGGRFLYVPKPDDHGLTFIDFNKAYNPPCAFTPYATCPLPPEQNRLPIRVTAGEKKYGEGH